MMWLPLFHQKDLGNHLLQGSMIFMDRRQNKTRIDMNLDKKDLNSSQISNLHYNVQSLKNKFLELTVLLQLDLKNVGILCFTEHWLKWEHIGLIKIDNFKLISTYILRHVMWPSVFRCLECVSSWRDIILFFFHSVRYEECSAVIWILMKDKQEEPPDYTRAQLCPPQCYIYLVHDFMCIWRECVILIWIQKCVKGCVHWNETLNADWEMSSANTK
jgi:hypothetical protein